MTHVLFLMFLSKAADIMIIVSIVVTSMGFFNPRCMIRSEPLSVMFTNPYCALMRMNNKSSPNPPNIHNIVTISTKIFSVITLAI